MSVYFRLSLADHVHLGNKVKSNDLYQNLSMFVVIDLDVCMHGVGSTEKFLAHFLKSVQILEFLACNLVMVGQGTF